MTRNPHALWVVQQMREAWPYAPAHRFLWFDRDSKFGADVVSAVRDMGSQPTRTAFRSPWQNGVAERWVGSCRRDLLDHVIVLNERHLKRLMVESHPCAKNAQGWGTRLLIESGISQKPRNLAHGHRPSRETSLRSLVMA
jgi:transposase InsO family protein